MKQSVQGAVSSESELLAVLDFDRSRHARVELRFGVECLADGRRVRGEVTNISIKGVRAVFEERISQESPVRLRIEFTRGEDADKRKRGRRVFIETFAEVIWEKEDDLAYGLAFVTMDASYQRWLAETIEKMIALGNSAG